MLMRHPSEEGLLVRVDALLVAIVDKGTSSDSANDAECYTSVEVTARFLLSMSFFGLGG